MRVSESVRERERACGEGGRARETEGEREKSEREWGRAWGEGVRAREDE